MKVDAGEFLEVTLLAVKVPLNFVTMVSLLKTIVASEKQSAQGKKANGNYPKPRSNERTCFTI